MEKCLNEISLLWNNIGLFNDISKLPSLDQYNYDLINLENTDSNDLNKTSTNIDNENVILNNINTISHKWKILLDAINNNANELKLHEDIIHNLSELTVKEIQLHNNFKHINNNYNNLLSIKQSLSAKISRIEHIYNYYNNVNNYEKYINNINSNIVKVMSTNDLSNANKILDELINLILKIKNGINFFTLNNNYYKSDSYKNKYHELFKLLLYYIKLFIKLYVFVLPQSNVSTPRNSSIFNNSNNSRNAEQDMGSSTKDRMDNNNSGYYNYNYPDFFSNNTNTTSSLFTNNKESISLINKLLINITEEYDDILQIQVYYVNYRLNLINNLFTIENFNFSFKDDNNTNNKDNNQENNKNSTNQDILNTSRTNKDNLTKEIEYATNYAVHLIKTEMHLYKMLFDGVDFLDNYNVMTLVNIINSNFSEYLKRYYNTHIVQELSKNNYGLNNVLVVLNDYKVYLVNINNSVNISQLNNCISNVENLLLNNFNNNFNTIYNNNIYKNYPYTLDDYNVVNNLLKYQGYLNKDNNNENNDEGSLINNNYVNPVVYYIVNILNNYNFVINYKKLNKLILNNIKKSLDQFVNNYFKKFDNNTLNKSLVNINLNIYVYNNYFYLINNSTNNKYNNRNNTNQDNNNRNTEHDMGNSTKDNLTKEIQYSTNSELLNELNNNLNNLKKELMKLLTLKLSEYKSDNSLLSENLNKLYKYLLFVNNNESITNGHRFVLDLLEPVCQVFNLPSDFKSEYQDKDDNNKDEQMNKTSRTDKEGQSKLSHLRKDKPNNLLIL